MTVGELLNKLNRLPSHLRTADVYVTTSKGGIEVVWNGEARQIGSDEEGELVVKDRQGDVVPNAFIIWS